MKKQLKDDIISHRVNKKNMELFKERCDVANLTKSKVLDWLMFKVIIGDIKLNHDEIIYALKK